MRDQGAGRLRSRRQRQARARCPNGTSPTSIPVRMRRSSRPISKPPSAPPTSMQERYQRQARDAADGGKGGAALAQAVREFEALNDHSRPHRFLCEPALCRRHLRSEAAEILRRHAGEDHGDLLQAAVLPARAEPARGRRAREGDGASELGHYRPWLEDLRKEKPYQLDDKLEQLFHEKAVTARGAWNRLFNETMTSLRFDVDGEKLSLEPTLNRLLDQDEDKRRAAAEALAQGLQGERAAVHADHQHARQGQGNLRPLARLRRRRRFTPSRQPGGEARSSTRWSPPCARPIPGSRIAITR